MNDIISFLNLEDENVIVDDTITNGTERIIMLSTKPEKHFCPSCSFVMHSRGIKVRTINHPVLHEHFHLTVQLKQRRWRCTNPHCKLDIAEEFNFVGKNCRNTNSADLLILESFKDLNSTAVQIAKKHHVSDTYALNTFDRYVNMPRLPLGIAVSVDEVYINMPNDSAYALVVMDFVSGEPIDLLPSRKKYITEPFFLSIPLSERAKVKYLVCDMYNEYIRYVDRYFPNATPVVDSFHVIQWIENALEQYLRNLQTAFENRDKERQNNVPLDGFGRQRKLPMSDEVYLLKNYRFFLLRNEENIKRHQGSHMDRHFRYYMNTADYENKFFSIDPNLSVLRELRDKYIRFNQRNAGKPQKAKVELQELINEYANSGQEVFINLGRLLKKYEIPIINSFVLLNRIVSNRDDIVSRLSNGPMEAMNRRIKDLKRNAHGFRNFSHLRNRFLYASRNNPIFDGREKDKPNGKSIRFVSSVNKRTRETLMDEYQLLKEKYSDITEDEEMALRHWIAQGNSPYNNPDNICDEWGVITDFITASRILDNAFDEN